MLHFALDKMGKTQHHGYSYDEITPYVFNPLIEKVLFLLQNMKQKYRVKFYQVFYHRAMRMLDKADIIHVINSTENSAIIRAAHDSGKTVILEQIVGYDYKYYMSGNVTDTTHDEEIRIYQENLNSADYVMCPSQFVIDSITMHDWGKKMKNRLLLIPYGVSLDDFPYTKKKYTEKHIKLITVAGVGKRKGIDYLLDAMEKLESENVHLTVYGVPLGQEGQKMVERMNSAKNVTYAGTISHTQIAEAYRKHDVFILPSLVEGSSLSTYEALASGLPCIVTENVGSVVEDGIDGLIIAWKSTEAIVNAVRKFISHEVDLECMSKNARKKAEMYTWDEFELKVSQLYDSIL